MWSVGQWEPRESKTELESFVEVVNPQIEKTGKSWSVLMGSQSHCQFYGNPNSLSMLKQAWVWFSEGVAEVTVPHLLPHPSLSVTEVT